MFSYVSYDDSIDCAAPCAKEGGKANKASPVKKIFLFDGMLKFLLTKTG